MKPVNRLRRRIEHFLQKVRDRVPSLSYEAYIGEVLIEDVKAVYVYAFDSDGKLRGGYEVKIEITTGHVKTYVVAASRFFAFCATSVPVVFGSDTVRDIWHERVTLQYGVQQLVVMLKSE